MFSMFNKLLICLCLADLLFLVSNIAVSPVSLQVCPVLSQHIYHLSACLDPLAVQHPDVPQPRVRQSLQSLHLSISHRQLHRGEAPGQIVVTT